MNVEIFEEQARKEHAYFCLIADKIEADPALLGKPLENIDRWMANGHYAQKRLLQWREKITAAQNSPGGLNDLLAILRDDSEEMRFFKGFSPMTGLLSREERHKLL